MAKKKKKAAKKATKKSAKKATKKATKKTAKKAAKKSTAKKATKKAAKSAKKKATKKAAAKSTKKTATKKAAPKATKKAAPKKSKKEDLMIGAGATAASLNPYAVDPIEREDDENMDFEAMSESMSGDDEVEPVEDTFTEGETDTFDDDADLDDAIEGDDDEGYF